MQRNKRVSLYFPKWPIGPHCVEEETTSLQRADVCHKYKVRTLNSSSVKLNATQLHQDSPRMLAQRTILMPGYASKLWKTHTFGDCQAFVHQLL